MRTFILIAAAGLTIAAIPARAQYYGWGYYQPYVPVPYGYYPGPFYAPPPDYDEPPRRSYRRHAAARFQHRSLARRQRVDPLLGPLPGFVPR